MRHTLSAALVLTALLSEVCCMGNSRNTAQDPELYNLSPLRRLTAVQYANTIADLFGPSVTVPVPQVVDIEVDGLPTAGAALATMGPSDVLAYATAAAALAAQITGPSYQKNLGCTPTGPGDSACLNTLLTTWGKRIFRRPLSAQQLSNYQALATAQMQGNFWNGMAAAFGAMLTSPYFLFRIDAAVGTGADPNAFDDYTLASRLSYLIWNSTPDATLLAAADAGQLHTTAGLSAQVDRLLQDPRADAALYNFFYEMLAIDGIATAQKDPNDFNSTLAAEMTTQVQMTITDVLLTNNRDYRTLFTTDETFVNQNLAHLYGYPVPSDSNFDKITFTGQDRAGLFGLPGILTMLAPSSRTSPTTRGKYIRDNLMCTVIPPPPVGVNTTVTLDPNTPQTMRQLMSAHASNPSCAACHNLMDPLGFALEDFDWLGRSQTSENGLPLDLSGSLDGTAFTNATTFGVALAADASIPMCLTQKFVAYATASLPSANSTLVTSLNQDFAANHYSVKSLAKSYVLSSAFTHPQ